MATPAAVLSIAVKASGVAATQRELGDLDKSGSRAGGSLAKFGKVMALGVAGGAVAAGAAVKKFVDAAKDSEVSSSAMKAQLKALGIDYGKHAKQIDKVIAKHSALSGLDDEDLQDSFTNIVRVTGDVNKALELNGLAADFARAKGIDVAKAGELVGKVAGGNIGILSRYGIQVEKGATAQEALAEMQKRFAGQAEAFGNTAAGAQEKFSVATENLQEVLGERLLPIVTKVVGGVADFVNGMQTGEGAGGKFAAAVGKAFEFAKEKVGVAIEAIKGWLKGHKDDLDAARHAAENIGKAIQWAFENVALPVIQRVLPVIQQFVTSTFKQIGGIIDLIVGLLTGDFSRAWEGIQAIVKGALDKTLALLGLAWDAFKAAGGLLLDAVIAGFKALPGLILDLGTWIEDQFDKGVKAVLQGILAIGKWLLARVIDGIKAGAKPLIDVGVWVKDRLMDGLQAVVDGVKSLGKWLLARWVEGLKAEAQLVTELGAWLKNRIMDGLTAALEGIKALGSWVLDKVVDGLKARADLVTALAGWVKNRLMDGLEAAVDAVKGIGGWILDRIIDGLKNVGSKIKSAVVAIKDAIVDAIKDVFKDALSIPLKISLPKIDLPFGGSGGGNVGPGKGPLPSHVSGFDDDARGFGNIVTSGYRPGDDGWHGQNRARDYSGGNMLGFARYMAANFGGRLLELIHTPMGFGIKNGQRVPLSFWGGAVNADHYDHVHVALANGGYLKRGGWAVVGERGPELAHLPSGASVYSNRDSRGMVGGGTTLHAVIDLGRGIQQRMTLEFDEHGRQTRGQYVAGRLT